MSDLISRQAVLNALKEHRSLFCDNTPETFSKLSYAEKSRVDELDTAIATIVNLPSVESKGEWERVSGGSFIDVYRCSKCKHEPPKKPLPDIKTWGWDFTDFCPNCGAKMKGSE